MAESPRLSRRRKVLIGAVVAAAVVGGGAVAVAGHSGEDTATGPGVSRQDNGVVAIDGNALDGWYRGEVISSDRVEDLYDDGKAPFSHSSIELACHGAVAYFDTEAEGDAYMRALQRPCQGDR